MKLYKLPNHVTLVTHHGLLKPMPAVRQGWHITPISRQLAAQRLRSDRQRKRELRAKAYGVLQAAGYSEIGPNGESVREPRNEVRTKGGRLPKWL